MTLIQNWQINSKCCLVLVLNRKQTIGIPITESEQTTSYHCYSITRMAYFEWYTNMVGNIN